MSQWLESMNNANVRGSKFSLGKRSQGDSVPTLSADESETISKEVIKTKWAKEETSSWIPVKTELKSNMNTCWNSVFN